MQAYWRLTPYYFFYFAFIGAFSPYITLYLASLGLSAWDIGVLMSLMQVMRIVAPNLWGWLAAGGGATTIIRTAAVLSCVGFCGFFFAREFVGLFAAMAVLAFFWSAALPLVEALTLGHLGSEVNRYGTIRLWGSIGFIAAVLGVGYLLDRMPLPTLLWACAAVLAGIAVCSFLLQEAGVDRHRDDDLPLRSILRQPAVLLLLSACLLMSAAHGPLYVFYSIHLVEHGYGKSAVGWLWTLGVLAEILVFYYMPALLRTFSLQAILIFSFGCAAVRFLLIGWGIESLALVLAAQLLHGASFGSYHAAAVASISRWFPGRHQARGQALYTSVSFGAGGMLGGLFSGYAWGMFGAGLTFSLGSLFALAGLVAILGTVSESSIRPSQR
jgi:PPP family 3-phenylpropionic acid transporter